MSLADIGKIFTAQEKISAELEGQKEIHRSIVLMELILSGLVTRMNEVESRVESLEAAKRERQDDPATSKREVNMF